MQPAGRTPDLLQARRRTSVRTNQNRPANRAFFLERPTIGPRRVRSQSDSTQTHKPTAHAKKSCKCKPFLKRLMGFEPTTFCMASRTCSPDSVRKVAGNSGFPRYRRGVGFPGFHWETTGLGHRMGTRAGLVGVGGFEPRSRDHERERAGTAARSSQDKDLPGNLEWVYGEGAWRRSPSVRVCRRLVDADRRESRAVALALEGWPALSTCYRASASARPARPGMPSLR